MRIVRGKPKVVCASMRRRPSIHSTLFFVVSPPNSSRGSACDVLTAAAAEEKRTSDYGQSVTTTTTATAAAPNKHSVPRRRRKARHVRPPSENSRALPVTSLFLPPRGSRHIIKCLWIRRNFGRKVEPRPLRTWSPRHSSIILSLPEQTF